jgi:hypothetical protein
MTVAVRAGRVDVRMRPPTALDAVAKVLEVHADAAVEAP